MFSPALYYTVFHVNKDNVDFLGHSKGGYSEESKRVGNVVVCGFAKWGVLIGAETTLGSEGWATKRVIRSDPRGVTPSIGRTIEFVNR